MPGIYALCFSIINAAEKLPRVIDELVDFEIYLSPAMPVGPVSPFCPVGPVDPVGPSIPSKFTLYSVPDEGFPITLTIFMIDMLPLVEL